MSTRLGTAAAGADVAGAAALAALMRAWLAGGPGGSPAVLAAAGLVVGGELTEPGQALAAALEAARPRPCYKDGQLRWRGEVILTLRGHARNMRLLVASFEELKWPDAIFDPLPVRKGVPRKDRLHEAVKKLRRRLRGKGIDFHESGQQVRWERTG